MNFKHGKLIHLFAIPRRWRKINLWCASLIKGGIQSLPSMEFPGGVLVGDNAGTLIFSKIKGSHTAMKSGMLAAEAIFNNIDTEWS